MNNEYTWETRFEKEISRAEKAKAAGNEGLARVCARRAAGVVIGEFLDRTTRNSYAPTPQSAYGRLKYLANTPNVSEKVREVAEHMLLRITEDHELPIDVDLVTEARWLAKVLLNN